VTEQELADLVARVWRLEAAYRMLTGPVTEPQPAPIDYGKLAEAVRAHLLTLQRALPTTGFK